VDPFGGQPDASLFAAATTTTYATVLVCQLVSITGRRSGRGLFTRYTFTNPTYWAACGAGIAIMLAIIYVPVLQVMFGTASLGPIDWALILAAALIHLAASEILGVIRRSAAHTSADRGDHERSGGSPLSQVVDGGAHGIE
jgi:Ca2+-transporting ATPase